MKKFIAISCMLISYGLSFSQCEDGRYRDLIFPSFTLSADLEYGSNYDLNGTLINLLMDVYEPTGDTETARPLVVVAHGGSFVSGSKEGTDVVPMCEDLARMGYVVATINYRLGLPITLNLEQPAVQAVMRGTHDIKAAVRYFRMDAENGNTWNIDPDKIYSAGVSAGAFITLHQAYMDEESEIPEIINQSLLGLGGGIEGESGNPGYSSDVAGIINIAGALGDTAWMNMGDEPVCSFHGTGDNTVPFGSAMLYLLESFAVTEVDGSSSIDLKAEEVGIAHCFEIYEQQGHVPHVTNVLYYDTTLSIMSNFLSHLVCPDIELDCDYRSIQDVGTFVTESSADLISVYPNPVRDWLYVGTHEKLQFKLHNNLGQLVDQGFTSVGQINLSQLKKGIYILELWGAEMSSRQRIIKQ